MFKWDEKYKIGIWQIDEQHQELFRIAGQAYNLLNETREDKFDDIIEVIKELQRYTVYHFNTEEGFMTEHNYDGFRVQKQQHGEFVNKIYSIEAEQINEDQEDFILGLLCYVSEWLINHILEEDMKMVKLKRLRA
ncbi:bacteriohemerythrin [Heliophilum fasciatum]|uniref:Hemerythrin n=1 Tax=Heliophilum fasciatum TaxID=35700 RepID=A0A4R2RK82_9FIRM|nr:hemerythrin family protein [Heliophilum fasciatum]MCW2279386.1 hemerythrin [Heliophilum fasciatum]TCP60101.1 hemerythrin [Heliophilum fasciatum]